MTQIKGAPLLGTIVAPMARNTTLFTDRTEAGLLLAAQFSARRLEDVIVYALPRGGVPVAFEIAKALNAPMDLILVRKIGAPGAPELALAAVMDGDHPKLVVNKEVQRLTGASDEYLAREEARELAEIERRRRLYFGNRRRPDPRGMTAIVVDDGLATGATARAGIEGLRAHGVAKVILAVPVAPADTAAAMRADVDELICLAEPETFYGVGSFYRDFHQLSDEEVLDKIALAARFGQSKRRTDSNLDQV